MFTLVLCVGQVDRMDTIAAVHDFRVRVIVATDLASRGLDMANVNLVRRVPSHGICSARHHKLCV